MSATSTPAASMRSTRTGNGSASSPPTPSSALTTRRTTSSSSGGGLWSHTPSNLTLLWLAVSLPLVIWDTGYIMLRPHTFAGGSFYWPLYVPYALYGEIDHVYSIAAYKNKNGFTGAQATMNVLETALYFAYLYIVFTYGKEIKAKGRGAPKKLASMGPLQKLAQARAVGGPEAGIAVLVAFTACVMTVSKTMLYLLVQYCSDWGDIGHNTAFDLVFLYIIPNGAWLVVPTYLMFVIGQEILQGLEMVAGGRKRS